MCLADDIAKSYTLRAWYFGANDGRPQRLTQMAIRVSQLDILRRETDVPPNRDLCATSTQPMPWDFHVFDILPKRRVLIFVFLPETYRSGCYSGVENPHLKDGFSSAIASVGYGKSGLNLSQACLIMEDINRLG